MIGGATLDMAGHSLLCDPADRPDGIQVEGKGAKTLRGTVKDCHRGLIDVDGEGNKVEKWFATHNGAGGTDGGIALEGDGNQVKKSVAMDNNPLGIRAVDGAQGNAFQGNAALANDGADLVDENAGGTCDGNQWKKNVFGTSDAAGVASPACIQ